MCPIAKGGMNRCRTVEVDFERVLELALVQTVQGCRYDDHVAGLHLYALVFEVMRYLPSLVDHRKAAQQLVYRFLRQLRVVDQLFAMRGASRQEVGDETHRGGDRIEAADQDESAQPF